MSQDPTQSDKSPLSETDDKHSDLKETLPAQPDEDTRGTPVFQEEGSNSGEEKAELSQDSAASTAPPMPEEISAEERRAQNFSTLWDRLNDHLAEVEANMLVNVSDHDKKLYYVLWVSQTNATFRRLGTLRKRRSNPSSSKCG